jgi:hypothetical protein
VPDSPGILRGPAKRSPYFFADDEAIGARVPLSVPSSAIRLLTSQCGERKRNGYRPRNDAFSRSETQATEIENKTKRQHKNQIRTAIALGRKFLSDKSSRADPKLTGLHDVVQKSASGKPAGTRTVERAGIDYRFCGFLGRATRESSSIRSTGSSNLSLFQSQCFRQSQVGFA